MRTKAAVLAGKNEVYVREFDLPEISEEELLVKIISNSICLSTHKAVVRGTDHKRVPPDVAEHPAITGHEFAGIIEQVGEKLRTRFRPGQKFALQPAMGLPSGYSAGYSYETFGGNAKYCIIPKIAIDLGCVLAMEGSYFADASLAEPMSCIIGAYHASFHTKPYVYVHEMGIREGGSLALLGCAGPMGLGAIEYAIYGPVKPALVVVTDIDQNRLDRAEQLISPAAAGAAGVRLIYVNSSEMEHPVSQLKQLNGGNGYDDCFVFAPVKDLIEQGDQLLGNDGCLNFFSGPTNNQFSASMNFYNVHYEGTHVIGTSGGSTGDMLESLELSSAGCIHPSYMITHIGGLGAVPDTLLHLPEIPGGKKLIYPHIDMELTAIEDFAEIGKEDELFAALDQICHRHGAVWCEEAERFLLNWYEVI